MHAPRAVDAPGLATNGTPRAVALIRFHTPLALAAPDAEMGPSAAAPSPANRSYPRRSTKATPSSTAR
jgi:hypothetical protein